MKLDLEGKIEEINALIKKGKTLRVVSPIVGLAGIMGLCNHLIYESEPYGPQQISQNIGFIALFLSAFPILVRADSYFRQAKTKRKEIAYRFN